MPWIGAKCDVEDDSRVKKRIGAQVRPVTRKSDPWKLPRKPSGGDPRNGPLEDIGGNPAIELYLNKRQS